MEKDNLTKEATYDLKSTLKTKLASRSAAQFAILLSVAVLAPALGVQLLTGTIVNATLFISASLFGLGGAILIGIIPSLVSVLVGFLSAAIFPMVPFIILSNAILVYLFLAFKKKNYWSRIFIASSVKFMFLYLISSFVIASFVSEKIADKLALMMSWPQFFTAISGGVLAYILIGKKNNHS